MTHCKIEYNLFSRGKFLNKMSFITPSFIKFSTHNTVDYELRISEGIRVPENASIKVN